MESVKCDVRGTLLAGCSVCTKDFQGKSIHLLKCKIHALCWSCLMAKSEPNPGNACFLCSMNSAISLPLSGNSESLSQGFSSVNLGKYTSPQYAELDSTHDLRRGVEYVDTWFVQDVEDLWGSQAYGSIVLLCNKPNPSLLYLDSEGNKTSITIPGIVAGHYGIPVSDNVTALVVQKLHDAPVHLALYSASPQKASAKIVRLFSEKSPAHPRSMFLYDSKYFGIYSRKPSITLMRRDHYEIYKTIELNTQLKTSDGDKVAVNSDGDFFVSFPRSSRILQFNSSGEVKHKIGIDGHGYRDPPGSLRLPMSVYVDAYKNILVGVANGSLNLYADRRWSMIKMPTEPGHLLKHVLFAHGFVFIVSAKEDDEKFSLVKYKQL